MSMGELRGTARPSRFVSGIAYTVGSRRAIEVLAEAEGVSAETIVSLRKNGLEALREDERTIPDMCMASARETLQDACLSPDRIGTIVLASSNSDALVSDEDETELFAALHAAGFVRARIIGLTLQSCSASGDALAIASDIAAGTPDGVLVIVFAQRKKMSRLGLQGNVVFSDGAVSCIVSTKPGGFAIRATESVTHTRLGALGRSGGMAQFQGGVIELGAISRRVFAAAGIRPADTRAFFGTNAGIYHLKLMAQAAGVPLDRVYFGDIAGIGHVHSCDGLISLKNYAARQPIASGDCFMLLSWSPHVFCASILEYLGGERRGEEARS
jgi:3-oxoacyl-[acyl-carrier-protein] synthase III